MIQQITFDLHIAAERACELLVLPAEAFERLEGSCEAVRSFVHARTAEPLLRRDGGRAKAAVRAVRPGGWQDFCWPKAKKTARARCV